MKELPDTWQSVALGETLTRITYGFTNPMPTTDSGPFMVTAKDVRGGRIDYATARHTSQQAYDHLLTDKSRPLVGDVLLTKDGSIGRVAVVDRPDICINQSVALLQPNTRIESRYLAYLLQAPSYQAQMERDADGSTIKHIYITRVDKMQIALPPKGEQHGIAGVLVALDDKIESNRRIWSTALDLLEASRVRLTTAAISIARTATLGQLVTFNETTINPAAPDARVVYVDIAGVSPGTIDVRQEMRWAEAPSRARRGVRDGDVIFSTVRPTRRSFSVILDPDPDVVVSTGFAVMTPRSIGTAFLLACVADAEFASYCEGVSQGSAYPAVSVDAMGKYEIDLPMEEELRRMEFDLMPALRHGHRAVIETEVLAALRDALLPELLSGRLRVREAENVIEGVV